MSQKRRENAKLKNKEERIKIAAPYLPQTQTHTQTIRTYQTAHQNAAARGSKEDPKGPAERKAGKSRKTFSASAPTRGVGVSCNTPA